MERRHFNMLKKMMYDEKIDVRVICEIVIDFDERLDNIERELNL